MSVMAWALLVVPTVWLENVKLVGAKLMVGVAAAPVPVSATVCGLPEALSAMLTEAVRVPEAEGVKVMLMVHVPLAATELPQVLVCAKLLLLVPVRVTDETVSDAVPVFVRVMAWALLVVPTV